MHKDNPGERPLTGGNDKVGRNITTSRAGISDVVHANAADAFHAGILKI
jgi:hypothetical protein